MILKITCVIALQQVPLMRLREEKICQMNSLNAADVICTSTFSNVHQPPLPHASLSWLGTWFSELRRRVANGEVRMFILIHILTLISPWWKYGSPETIMTLIWALGMSLFC